MALVTTLVTLTLFLLIASQTTANSFTSLQFRPRDPTPFTTSSGLNANGAAPGTFHLRNLRLRIDGPALVVDYELALSRLSSHFPEEVLTPANSRAELSLLPVSRNCTFNLTVRPNRAPRGMFVYEGRMPGFACNTAVGTTLQVRVGLPFIRVVEFVRAEQSDFAGGSFPTRISRSRDGPASSADLR